MTGVANVTPTAGQVGKFMGKNLGAAAVVGAVDLLLDGVDWVIDEGGKVTKKNTDTPFNDPSVAYYYSGAGFSASTAFVSTKVTSFSSDDFSVEHPNSPKLTTAIAVKLNKCFFFIDKFLLVCFLFYFGNFRNIKKIYGITRR